MATKDLSLGERILTGHGSEFAGLLETLGEAVIVRDRADHFVYANRAAIGRFGMSSLDELIGHPLSDLLHRYHVYDEQGRPVSREQIPSVRSSPACRRLRGCSRPASPSSTTRSSTPTCGAGRSRRRSSGGCGR